MMSIRKLNKLNKNHQRIFSNNFTSINSNQSNVSRRSRLLLRYHFINNKNDNHQLVNLQRCLNISDYNGEHFKSQRQSIRFIYDT